MADLPVQQLYAPYSVLPALADRWSRVGRALAFDAQDCDAHTRWKRRLVKRLKALTGYDTIEPCPLNPRITEQKAMDGYTRSRIEIDTEAGVTMPLFALIPQGDPPRDGWPAVLCPHGHGGGGKAAVAGVADLAPEIANAIAHYRYDYGVQFARAGLAAFCPDARGFGERQEPRLVNAGGSILDASCQLINNMAIPLGQTISGMWAWDLHRLAEYVRGREDCDGRKLGCAGLSGGGLQTLMATALDTRRSIKAAVISGYFYGFKQSLLEMHHNCACNYVPHLYETADVGDLAALIAPRPMLIETGTRDRLNGRGGMDNVLKPLETVRRAYQLFGTEDRLVHDVFEGEHRWHGQRAVSWMKEQLSASKRPDR